jgi:hypothetical protein
VIRKVGSEKPRANHIDHVTQRRTKTATDKDQKIVHLKLSPDQPAGSAGFAASLRSPQALQNGKRKGRQLDAAALWG